MQRPSSTAVRARHPNFRAFSRRPLLSILQKKKKGSKARQVDARRPALPCAYEFNPHVERVEEDPLSVSLRLRDGAGCPVASRKKGPAKMEHRRKRQFECFALLSPSSQSSPSPERALSHASSRLERAVGLRGGRRNGWRSEPRALARLSNFFSEEREEGGDFSPQAQGWRRQPR